MNKILVKLYVPKIDKQYDVLIPPNKNICNIIHLLTKAIDELNLGYYKVNQFPLLYDKSTGKPYDIKLNIKETNIRNGKELMLI